MSLGKEELLAFVDEYMKPLFKIAVRAMPRDEFFGVLVGYAVAVGRGAGLSDDDMRKVLDSAIGSNSEARG